VKTGFSNESFVKSGSYVDYRHRSALISWLAKRSFSRDGAKVMAQKNPPQRVMAT
jgi:hypothetical protein